MKKQILIVAALLILALLAQVSMPAVTPEVVKGPAPITKGKYYVFYRICQIDSILGNATDTTDAFPMNPLAPNAPYPSAITIWAHMSSLDVTGVTADSIFINLDLNDAPDTLTSEHWFRAWANGNADTAYCVAGAKEGKAFLPLSSTQRSYAAPYGRIRFGFPATGSSNDTLRLEFYAAYYYSNY